MKKVDFHIHTNLSDGVYSPEEVVDMAIYNDCHEIAITDHDYIADYHALAETKGITIIPGIEFNTSVKGMHLLGYNITDIELVNHEMDLLKLKNEVIVEKVIDMLERAGYDVSLNKVIAYLESINQRQKILDKRQLVKYLIYMGYAEDTLKAYKTLIGKYQPFYIPNYKLSPEAIIKLVNEAKGITVLAHPGSLNKPMDELTTIVSELKDNGLVGMEIINGKMKPKAYYEIIAEKLKLLKTVGSDFHNLEKDNIGIEVSDNLYEPMVKKLIKK